MGNLYRFVEPVVLYLLAKRGPCHGYELGRELNEHALTDSEIDRGALYRTLQRLERNGHVRSFWDLSSPGPARHIYAITDSGRRHLREWCTVLENLADSLASFAREAHEVVPDPSVTQK